MINDKKMLEAICKSSDMGRESLKQVLEKTNDPALKKALNAQITEYEKNYQAAAKLLSAADGQPKQASSMAKIQSQIMTSVKTLTSLDTTSKIAEMVIQGSTMGVTKITKELHDYIGGNPKVKALAEKHLRTEQANIEEMKKFL